jgi:hypothetical protein
MAAVMRGEIVVALVLVSCIVHVHRPLGCLCFGLHMEKKKHKKDTKYILKYQKIQK